MRIIDDNGPAFLDMHLHMLRKLITRQSDVLFEDAQIRVPSSCVSVVFYLQEKKRASITELSESLRYSHQLINQRLAILEDLGLIAKTADPRDRRRSRITLTRAGNHQANKLQQLIPRLNEALAAAFAEIGTDVDVAIRQLQQRLEEQPLADRMRD